MIQLEPCPSCKRHIKLDEAACPFCSTPLSDDFRAQRARPRPRARLGLRATFAFGLTVATGCGGKDASSADAGAPEDAALESTTVIVVPPSGESPSPIVTLPDAGSTPAPIDAAPWMPDEGIGIPIYKASPP